MELYASVCAIADVGWMRDWVKKELIEEGFYFQGFRCLGFILQLFTVKTVVPFSFPNKFFKSTPHLQIEYVISFFTHKVLLISFTSPLPTHERKYHGYIEHTYVTLFKPKFNLRRAENNLGKSPGFVPKRYFIKTSCKRAVRYLIQKAII